MAKTISPDHGLKKEKILLQSTKAFALHGYHNTSMDMIAKNGNMSKSLIYYYYNTKNELLFQCMIEYVSRLVNIIHNIEGLELSSTETFEKIISAFLKVYGKSRYHHIVLVNELKNLNKTQRALVVSKQDILIHTLGRLLIKINPTLKDKEGMETVAAMLLFGAINWTYTWFKPNGPVTRDELSAYVYKVFHIGMAQ